MGRRGLLAALLLGAISSSADGGGIWVTMRSYKMGTTGETLPLPSLQYSLSIWLTSSSPMADAAQQTLTHICTLTHRLMQRQQQQQKHQSLLTAEPKLRLASVARNGDSRLFQSNHLMTVEAA